MRSSTLSPTRGSSQVLHFSGRRPTPLEVFEHLDLPLVPEAIRLLLDRCTDQTAVILDRLVLLDAHQDLVFYPRRFLPRVCKVFYDNMTWQCSPRIESSFKVLCRSFCHRSCTSRWFLAPAEKVALGGLGLRRVRIPATPHFVTRLETWCSSS